MYSAPPQCAAIVVQKKPVAFGGFNPPQKKKIFRAAAVLPVLPGTVFVTLHFTIYTLW